MAVTAKKLGQAALNVSGSVVTLVTGVTGGHTEITSIYLCNTNGSTARTVTLLAHGTGVGVGYQLMKVELKPAGQDGSTMLLQLNNAPIILAASETLRAYQDTGTDVTATAYGLEEV